jgi:hypothetical protein
MSTPAAAALSDAGGAPAAPAPGAAPAAPAASPNAFWNGWSAPEQKETREWVANKNYPDTFTLAKTAQSLEREAATLRAGKGYPVDKPGADGKPVRDENAWKAWNTLTGVPESPDKYEIPVPEANPYPQFKGYMAEEFHKAGVPAAMATQLAKGYESAVARMEAELQKAENTASEQGLAQLKDTWGANFQERMAIAGRGKEWLAKEVGGLSDIQMRTLESVLGTPKFLSAMWKIGAGNGEARFAGSDQPGGNRFQGGASEARARLDHITTERSAGRINDSQWRELAKQGGEIEQLTNQIAAGFAPPQQ